MKKLFACVVLVCATAVSVFAQQNVKKYVLMEHFTNTRCGVCAANNPGYYNTINAQAQSVHHISIHSSIPYSACVLYQANTAPQDARATYYGLAGTPSVSINGANLVSANSINATNLTTEVAKTSPIAVRVSEISGVAGYTANIDIKTYNTIPSGTYKLFVAVVEKTVAYAAPNGESTHKDVFRRFLSATTGDDITLASIGNTANKSYNISNFDPATSFVLAFVQETASKVVLNSGTRFDPNLTALEDLATQQNIHFYPNPVTNGTLTWTADANVRSFQNVQIFNMLGQNVFAQKTWNAGETINLSNLTSGIYELRLMSETGKIAIQKIVVQ